MAYTALPPLYINVLIADVCSLEEKQLDERLLITDYDEISNMLPTRTMQND
ncbi:hypothetical protein IMSAGC006_01449 [Muribaculaceae bacterium]|jgi:hypothetical protein|nr:hypothetical protein IMSAGC006_01449 [Muribaculaceae bacterium]